MHRIWFLASVRLPICPSVRLLLKWSLTLNGLGSLDVQLQLRRALSYGPKPMHDYAIKYHIQLTSAAQLKGQYDNITVESSKDNATTFCRMNLYRWVFTIAWCVVVVGSPLWLWLNLVFGCAHVFVLYCSFDCHNDATWMCCLADRI